MTPGARPAPPAGPGGPGDAGEPRTGIPLGRIGGVPVSLAWSWFVIAATIVVLFGPEVARRLPGSGASAYAVALAYAVLLLLSVLAHELAHALVARAYGWPGARIVLTLMGGHTQFGSVSATPGSSLAVALAGPAANFALAGIATAVLAGADPAGAVGLLLVFFQYANLLVAVFNVLPGLPLDGGRLVESAVWSATGSQERGTVAAGWAGRAIVVALVAYVVVLPYVLGGTPDLQLAIIGLLVAAFMWTGASQAIANARMRLRLPRIAAGELMVPATGVPAAWSVADLDAHVARHGEPVLLTGAGGAPEAIVDSASLRSVPGPLRATTAAGTVARALAPGAVVPAEAAGRDLIDRLAPLAGSEYAVVDPAGRVVGLLVQSAVVAAITGKRR